MELAVIDDRKEWHADNYALAIRSQLTGSLLTVCVLLKELKEKFFLEEADTGKAWTRYCKEEIGLSRQTVSSYLRIGKYVLPKIGEKVADKLGTKKLLELAKLEDKVEDIKDEIHEDMSLRQVKKVVEDHIPEHKKKVKKKKDITQLKRAIKTLDDDLSEYLPETDDFEGKKRFNELANQLYNDLESLMNIVQMLRGAADD